MVPPGKKLFNDVGLKYFQDSNWLHAPLWLSDHLMNEAGVGIESREMYDGGDAVAKILPAAAVAAPPVRLRAVSFAVLRRLRLDRTSSSRLIPISRNTRARAIISTG